MSLVFFKKDDVAILGKTASYPSTADSGNINTRHFCPTCGSRVYGGNSGRPGVIGIAVGCLDKNDWFSAQAVVYTKGRAAWDKTPEDVPTSSGCHHRQNDLKSKILKAPASTGAAR